MNLNIKYRSAIPTEDIGIPLVEGEVGRSVDWHEIW